MQTKISMMDNGKVEEMVKGFKFMLIKIVITVNGNRIKRLAKEK